MLKVAAAPRSREADRAAVALRALGGVPASFWHWRDWVLRKCTNFCARAHDARRYRAHLVSGGEAIDWQKVKFGAGALLFPARTWWGCCRCLRVGGYSVHRTGGCWSVRRRF